MKNEKNNQDVEKDIEEYRKDVQARRLYHRKMNFHYLMYKGISLLNDNYNKEVLDSLGMQIHIPRTFMTIESIRPDLDHPLEIFVKARNKNERVTAESSMAILKGEWSRSNSNKPKIKAQFDSLIYGTGYLLSLYDKEFDEEGNVVFEGMRIKRLDPYYVIPDRKAKTYDSTEHNCPRHIWVPSIWDFEVFKEYAKEKGWSTDGLEKGGELEEFDEVRNKIDAIYTKNGNLKTRDNGTLVNGNSEENTTTDSDNIGVVTKYTKDYITVYAGVNWTKVTKIKRIVPKREIPIYPIKDYDIPGELEGIGEPEVLRWQQYEENKIHNLMYLQVLLNTVKRFGIIEEMLVDPTDIKMSNPLKPIRLKYMGGQTKVNDAIQILQQPSPSDVPLNVLQEIKNIGQMATGQSDYSIGSNKGDAGTLGEAEMMGQAGSKRIREKIIEGEDRGLSPILSSWLSAIPKLYTEDLDFILNDKTDIDVKFLPFDRKLNKNATKISELAVKEGKISAQSVEEIYLSLGYQKVVFISDILQDADVQIKTSTAFLEKNNLLKQYQSAIAEARLDNTTRAETGQPPIWDTSKLTEELLRQFPDVIEDVEEYKIKAPEATPMAPPNSGGPLTNVPELAQIPEPIPTAMEQIQQ